MDFGRELFLMPIDRGTLRHCCQTRIPSCTEPNCDDCKLQRDLFLPESELQHEHTASVTTMALVKEGTVSLQKINKWLATLLWPNQDEQDKVLRERLEDNQQTGEVAQTEFRQRKCGYIESKAS